MSRFQTCHIPNRFVSRRWFRDFKTVSQQTLFPKFSSRKFLFVSPWSVWACLPSILGFLVGHGIAFTNYANQAKLEPNYVPEQGSLVRTRPPVELTPKKLDMIKISRKCASTIKDWSLTCNHSSNQHFAGNFLYCTQWCAQYTNSVVPGLFLIVG